jgi:hypothetical protein
MKYKIDDPRLQELAADDTGLGDELALARWLLERNINNPRLAGEFLKLVGQLSTQSITIEQRAGRLLPIETLRAFAARLVGIITSELRDLPDWESRAERLMLRFRDAMTDVQPKRLTDDHD